MELYRFPAKRLRAVAIKRFMEQAGKSRAVCFSCGNASRALKEAGVETLDISKSGDLEARRWFTMAEIRKAFPNHFDATSGHIPIDCMAEVAREFRGHLQCLPELIYLPTGSGETLVELKLAFPTAKIIAVYDLDEATAYEEGAPLNGLVKALAEEVRHGAS